MDDTLINKSRKDVTPPEMQSHTGPVEIIRKLPDTWDELQNLAAKHDSQLKNALNAKGVLDIGMCDPAVKATAKYSLSAIDIGRPLGSVIVVLYGETKSGKSCTINRLLKKPLCQEGDNMDSSITKDCIEYTTRLSNFQEHVMFNLNLVDVPGTCDSGGTQADALNAGTLRKFLVTHSLLGHNGGRPTFALPNVVMVTFNAVTVTFPDQSTSKFYQTLQALKETGVVDKERLNLVIVGTHAMQVPKGHWKNGRMDKLRTMMALTAKSILDLDPAWEIPVVFVENDPDRDSDYQYDASNEFVMLPDGTRSHYNLFLALFRLFSTSGDNLGLLALITVWNVQEKLNPKKRHYVQSSPENLKSPSFRPIKIAAALKDHAQPFLPEINTSILAIRRNFSETDLAQVILTRSGLGSETALLKYTNLLKMLSRLKITTEDSLREHSIQDVENACLAENESLSSGDRSLLLNLGMKDDIKTAVLPTYNQKSTVKISEDLSASILLRTKVWFKEAWSWMSNVFTTIFK